MIPNSAFITKGVGKHKEKLTDHHARDADKRDFSFGENTPQDENAPQEDPAPDA